MPADLPQQAQPAVDAYMALLRAALPDLPHACYLHGSIALGDYRPPCSDIDFITVVKRPCAAWDLSQLEHIHQQLKREYPQAVFSGSYLQAHDLGQPEAAIAPSPYYHEGVLHAAGHHDLNAVTWWVLKTHGLALLGPPPQEMLFTMDWDAFLAATRENLNSYWVRFTREPRRMAWLLRDGGIQWAVLGVLRQYYTFAERGITSKTGAGQYALDHLPPRWQRLIREALNIRGQAGDSLYRLRISRAVEAVRFLRFAIDHCNRTFF